MDGKAGNRPGDGIKDGLGQRAKGRRVFHAAEYPKPGNSPEIPTVFRMHKRTNAMSEANFVLLCMQKTAGFRRNCPFRILPPKTPCALRSAVPACLGTFGSFPVPPPLSASPRRPGQGLKPIRSLSFRKACPQASARFSPGFHRSNPCLLR